MHLAKLALLLTTTTTCLSLLPTLASANCFDSGTTWGSPANRGRAASYLDHVCKELQGDYGASVIQSTCRNGGENIRFNFAVRHVSAGTRNLGKDECIDGLNKEITGCGRGGRTAYKNWEYA